MRHEGAVRIGAGGMGEVFKAWDPDLERWVALKYLRHDDPELVERLQREARAQARVIHPGVCRVYEVGSEDGRPFIAMEYVDGVPLDVAAARMTLEEKVLVLQRVAEAVQAAHAAGLVHRDLKPGNILVACGADGDPRPYVLDFGIAREQEITGLTVTGQILGTPGYLSPEQARGETSAVDRRTDVWSLGVVLYELVAGCLPFAGQNPAQLLFALLQEEPVPLRRRAPAVPRDLETVVAACLEKDSNRRYPSARALAEDLGRFLEGEPVQVRRPSRLDRLAARVRKHPKSAAAAALGALTVLALAALVAEARWSASRRVALAQRLGQEVERMEGLARQAYLLPLHDVRPDLAAVRERMGWIERETARAGVAARALGHGALGRGHLALGEAGRARFHLERAWELGERTPAVASALGLSFARLYREALEEAAQVRDPVSRSERTAAAERELGVPAREFLERSDGGGDPPEYLAAWLAFAAGDAAAALAHLARLRVAAPHDYRGDLLAGLVHRQRHGEALGRGDSAGAAAAFAAARAAFAAAAEVGRSDPRPYEELCALWVQALRDQHFASGGDLAPGREAALAACGEALVANPDSVAAHLAAGQAHRLWAAQQIDAGRDPAAALEAARAHARRVLELDPDSHAAHTLLGLCHRIAANAVALTGGDPRPDLEAAVVAYGEALRLRPDDPGVHTSLATAHLHLGADAAARGEDPSAAFEAAAAAARRATELRPGQVGAWVNLGIAEGQLGLWRAGTGGDADAAFARGRAALARAIEVNPEFLTAHYNLGELLLQQAEGGLRRGRDPAPLLDTAEPLLVRVRDRMADFAAPSFGLAQAAGLRAEWARRTGGDPAPHLARAGAATRAGRAVRGNDPGGLVLASFAPLVEARWRLARGLDPTPAVARGEELVAEALRINPSLAAGWLRRAELQLAAAAWPGREGGAPTPPLARAEEALARAAAANPSDATLLALTAELWRRRAERAAGGFSERAEALARGLEMAARAIAIDPAGAAAHAERARLERLAGRPADAASAWAEALRLDPTLAADGAVRPAPGS